MGQLLSLPEYTNTLTKNKQQLADRKNHNFGPLHHSVMNPRYLEISNFTYSLPEERIAKYPLMERDLSKLLVYKNGDITEDIYRNIDAHIPAHSLLVFNNTKVIHARMFFKNQHGGKVEIFCLEPAGEYTDMVTAMSATGHARWNCLVGRASKWKEKVLTCKTNEFTLTAELIDRSADAFIVEFKWLPENLSFAEILDKTGMMPIPPYLRRESEEIDLKRYQTVYALHEGSVAAPTAGLHFTEPLLEKLKANYVDIEYVTLHVGAGTFKPVKAARMEMHEMHAELIDVNKSTIQRLLQALQLGQPVIAVGTTSLRTIESLYWIGVKILQHPGLSGNNISVDQWAPYEHTAESTAVSVLDSLLAWMAKNNMERIVCKTQIMIAPPYNLKIASALVTNFHQPNSTLLLLVAAVTGNNWKEIYNYALLHQFRFLSYGDGSLLWGMKNTDGPV